MSRETESWKMFIEARKRGWKPGRAALPSADSPDEIKEWEPPAEPIITAGAGTSTDITAPDQGSQTPERRKDADTLIGK